jgi:hypothetical protein
MTRLAILFVLPLVLVSVGGSGASPTDASIAEYKEVRAEAPKVWSMKFNGGERATVIVKGDQKSKSDILIEIRDQAGQLITKDHDGGQFAAVIWYPPQTAVYEIKIILKGAAVNNCYVVVC